MLAVFEKETARVYSALGYKVRWINSDVLIAYGGALHCTTMQTAEIKFAPGKSPNTDIPVEID